MTKDLQDLTARYEIFLDAVHKLTGLWADTQDAWQCHLEGDTPQKYAGFLQKEMAGDLRLEHYDQ